MLLRSLAQQPLLARLRVPLSIASRLARSMSESSSQLSPSDRAKQKAAHQAVDDHVRSGMCVGIGSGSTVVYAVEPHRLHGRRAAILAVFIAGIVVFSVALVPLTDERWLYSVGDTEGHTHAEGLHDSGSWLMHYQRMHQRGDMDKFVPTL